MQMVVEDDGAEYIVSFVWFGSETQEMSVCYCSDIMRIWWAFGMHQDMGMCLFPFRAYEILSILHLSTKPPTSDFCVTTCWFPLSGRGFCFEYFSTWFSAGPPTSAPLHAQLSSSALRSAHFITRIAGMKTTSRILFQVFVCRFLKVEHCRLAAAFAYHFANLHISKE